MEPTTIGQLVAQDYRTAAVFKKYGIDFCCNGGRTVEEACRKKNTDTGRVLGEIAAVMAQTENTADDYKAWPLDMLSQYIEQKHHRYVEKQIPVLQAYLAKLCKVHGNAHPELHEIHALFNASAAELSVHMKKEELLLFPQVRKMVAARSAGNLAFAPPFGSFQNPIRMMMLEHSGEGDRFRKISELSHQYTVPPDGCNTYRVTYALLKEFENDLHLHIHLENNILFPGAVEMESQGPILAK